MAIAVPSLIVIALLLLGGLAAIVYGLIFAIANGRAGTAIALIVVPLLAVAALLLLVGGIKREHRQHAFQAEAARERAVLDAQRQLEAAQRHAEEATRRASELNAQVPVVGGGSMHQLFEKLTQPRIQLETSEQGASLKLASGPHELEVRSSGESESLAHSISRLERMVQQVSAAADQVSDAGTLVGKAMIALSETMDSRSSDTAPSPPAAESPDRNETPAPPVAAAAHAEMAEPSVAAKGGANRTPAETIAPSENGTWHDDVIEIEAPPEKRARPAWVNDPPSRVGDTRREVIVTEEYATTDECDRAMDVYLLLKTYAHLEQLLGMPKSEYSLPSLSFNGAGRGSIAADGKLVFEQNGTKGVWRDERIQLLNQMGIGIDYIRHEIVPRDREYYEQVDRDVGRMHKLYTQMQFTPSVDHDIRRGWNELRRHERFALVGSGAGSVLGLLGLAYGLMKVDTWTRGYYTKRLFLGVPAAIIGLLALLGFAAG